MPAPTYTLYTQPVPGVVPTTHGTNQAQHEAAINAALAAVYDAAIAGLNAGSVASLAMGGTADAMTGTLTGALAETTLYAGRIIRFLAPGVNTAASPTIEVGGVVYEIRDMQGGALPAGALRSQRYLAVVTSTAAPARVWLLYPIQIADIPGLSQGAALQRGSVAAAADLNLIVQPGTYFLAASGGYAGMPAGANPASAHWLDVRNYGGANVSASGRFVLQRLTSMASVLPGGGAHVYRPVYERRLDSENPADAGNVAAWRPVHAITPLAGKTVVCLGDSITQGGGEWDWPAMLAGLTGATVVNGGFGGCRMGLHSNALFDPFSMYRVSERIRYGTWSVLTAAADTLYASTGDDRRPAAARLAALDWSTVDTIVISYGTNDFGGDVPLGGDGDATGATLKGAINVTVANILAAYPGVRILFATPLWRSRVNVDGDDSNVTPNGLGVYLREYAQAIKDRAAAYALPVADLHATSGINILNWAPLMPDGLHPWSVAGVERVARLVAGALLAAPPADPGSGVGAPAEHGHEIADVTGLSAALAGLQPAGLPVVIADAAVSLTSAHNGRVLWLTHAAPVVTIQPEASHPYPSGFSVTLFADNGATVALGSGVSLAGADGGAGEIPPASDAAGGVLLRRAADAWQLAAPASVGDEASVAEARGDAASTWLSPAVVAAAATVVDKGAVAGVVTFSPADGPNQFFRVTGAVRFVPGVLFPAAGLIRVRLEGAHAVSWDASILRDEDDAALAPDGRAHVDTVYSYAVEDGRLRVAVYQVTPIVGAGLPLLGHFGGLYDPGAGTARVGDAASAFAGVGDPVKYLPPVGGTWTYTNSSGTTATLPAENRVYATADVANLPQMVDLDGRRGVRFVQAGSGLIGQLSGLQSIGVPNPPATADAMPYRTRLTWGAMVYLPPGGLGGTLGGVFRQENGFTGQVSVHADAAAKLSGRARMATSSVPQIGLAADVVANTAVRAAELPAALGRWGAVVWQLRIGSIDTTADTDPPGTTVRGEGAAWEMWIDDGTNGNVVVDMSSYRGANGLGFRCNRGVLGAQYSAATLQLPGDVVIGRHFVTTDDLTHGTTGWRDVMRWMGGV